MSYYLSSNTILPISSTNSRIDVSGISKIRFQSAGINIVSPSLGSVYSGQIVASLHFLSTFSVLSSKGLGQLFRQGATITCIISFNS